MDYTRMKDLGKRLVENEEASIGCPVTLDGEVIGRIVGLQETEDGAVEATIQLDQLNPSSAGHPPWPRTIIEVLR